MSALVNCLPGGSGKVSAGERLGGSRVVKPGYLATSASPGVAPSQAAGLSLPWLHFPQLSLGALAPTRQPPPRFQLLGRVQLLDSGNHTASQL